MSLERVLLVLVAILIGAGCGTQTGQGEGTRSGQGGAETTAQGGGQTTGRAGQLDQGAARIYPLPGEQVFPEGIALNEATGDFYAGSTRDGTVFSASVSEPGTEAEVLLEPGTDGRSAAIGMKVDAQ